MIHYHAHPFKDIRKLGTQIWKGNSWDGTIFGIQLWFWWWTIGITITRPLTKNEQKTAHNMQKEHQRITEILHQ